MARLTSDGAVAATLAPGIVDVAILSFESQQGSTQGRQPGGLSLDEQRRADRFRFDYDSDRFVRGRLWLREMLASYLRRDPSQIEFEYNEHGKPSIAKTQNPDNLEFSLAHSGDFAVLAVSSRLRVGVDIEKIDRLNEAIRIAQRYFSAKELEQLSTLSEPDRQIAFVAGWTRKEAFLKALGTGLSFSLSSFSVTLDPGQRPEFLELPAPLASEKWWVTDVQAPDGYRAALVVEGGPCIIRARNF